MHRYPTTRKHCHFSRCAETEHRTHSSRRRRLRAHRLLWWGILRNTEHRRLSKERYEIRALLQHARVPPLQNSPDDGTLPVSL